MPDALDSTPTPVVDTCALTHLAMLVLPEPWRAPARVVGVAFFDIMLELFGVVPEVDTAEATTARQVAALALDLREVAAHLAMLGNEVAANEMSDAERSLCHLAGGYAPRLRAIAEDLSGATGAG